MQVVYLGNLGMGLLNQSGDLARVGRVEPDFLTKVTPELYLKVKEVFGAKEEEKDTLDREKQPDLFQELQAVWGY